MMQLIVDIWWAYLWLSLWRRKLLRRFKIVLYWGVVENLSAVTEANMDHLTKVTYKQLQSLLAEETAEAQEVEIWLDEMDITQTCWWLVHSGAGMINIKNKIIWNHSNQLNTTQKHKVNNIYILPFLFLVLHVVNCAWFKCGNVQKWLP